MQQGRKKQRFTRLRRIRTKLILAFALLTIIPSVTVGGLSFLTSKDTVEKDMLAAVNESLNLLNASITNEIEAKIHHARFYAENLPSDLHGEDVEAELREEFLQYLDLHPEAASIYVANDDKVFILEPYVEVGDDFDVTERDWYQKTKENNGKPVISEPYISGDGKMVVTVSQTMKDGRGVAAVDIDLAYLQRLTNQVKIGDNGFAFLLDENYNFMTHPEHAAGSTASGEQYEKMYTQSEGEVPYESNGSSQIISFITNELTGWKIGGNLLADEIDELAAPILRTTAVVNLVALMIAAMLIFLIVRSIMNQLRVLRDEARMIGRGDLTGSIEVKTDDEIGQLGMAFNEMRDNLRELAQKVYNSANQLSEASEELSANTSQTTSVTEQVARVIQEVADGAEQQTVKVEENTRSLEEISQAVMKIAENSSKVTELSHQAARNAEDGGKAVRDTVEQMKSIYETVTDSNEVIKQLREQAKKVTSILAVITDIADQTNLLALNAAIEAARAGEHGRGFSVVAGEVKKLAEQSQQSANEIREIIEGIQAETNHSVTAMDRVMEDVLNGVEVSEAAIDKFEKIIQSGREMTPQLEDISASAQQMAAAVQELSSTSNELLAIARENAATSEEVAASAEEQMASIEEISASSKTLSKMAEELETLVSQFKY